MGRGKWEIYEYMSKENQKQIGKRKKNKREEKKKEKKGGKEGRKTRNRERGGKKNINILMTRIRYKEIRRGRRKLKEERIWLKKK
jgi:hypothetical protein